MVSVNSAGSSNRAHRGHEDVVEIARQGKADVKEQRAGIVNNPDMTIAEKKEALAALKKAESTYDQVINNGTKGTGFGGMIADLTNKNEGNLSVNWKLLEAAEASMAKVDTIMGKHEVSHMSPCDGPSCKGTDKTGGGNKAEGSGGTSGTSSSSKSDDTKTADQQKAYNANFAGKEPAELANMASADPKGFYDKLKDLSPEDRQSTMMMMNQYLQDMNQMFSMMSNLSKAQHDTAKALIGNMRV